MKKLLLLCLLLICGQSSNSNPKNHKQSIKKVDCLFCSEYKKLLNESKKLNYKSTADRARGEEIVFKVVDQISNHSMDKKNEEFLRLQLELIKEVSVYDFESQIAQILSEIFNKKNDLFLFYKSEINKLKKDDQSKINLCKVEYFEKNILEQMCFLKQKTTAADVGKNIKVQNCLYNFDYEKCLRQ